MRSVYDVLDEPPADADISWLWAELPPLREWLVRQFAHFRYDYDPDRFLGKVVCVALAQRPHLGSITHEEYLKTLIEKFVLTDPD